jgi:hypothetical protein
MTTRRHDVRRDLLMLRLLHAIGYAVADIAAIARRLLAAGIYFQDGMRWAEIALAALGRRVGPDAAAVWRVSSEVIRLAGDLGAEERD